MRELRVIPLLLEDDKKILPAKLTELITKCLKNETTRVSNVCNAFFGLNYKILLAIVIKPIGLEYEEWKVSGLKRDETGFKLITKRSEQERSFKDRNEAEAGFKKRVDELFHDVTDVGFESIFKALTACAIFDEEVVSQLPALMIKIGFGRTFYSRAPVDRLIKTVRKSLTDGTMLNFSVEQMKNFTNVFEGFDFIPLISGESDLRLKVFSVLRTLKVNNYAKFDDGTNSRIKTFLSKNRESYSEDINEISVLLEKDPRDQLLNRSLMVSSQNRIDFLYGVGLFDESQVMPVDLPEVLNLKNSTDELPKLRQKRSVLSERIRTLRDQGVFDEEFVLSVNQLSALQKKINYNIILDDSKEPLKIQDFILKFVEVTKGGYKKHVDSTIEALLFYTDHAHLEEPEALAILSILFHSNYDNFDDIPKNILEAIVHNEHHMAVIKFGSEKNLKNPKNFCNFMMKIFVVNDDKRIYRTVLQVCRKYAKFLDKRDQFIVNVEEEIQDIFSMLDIYSTIAFNRTLGLIEVIQELIDDKQMVTQNMFRFIQWNLKYEEVYILLVKLVKVGFQRMPNFLIDGITKTLNDQKVQESISTIELIELLVKRNFLKCSKVEKFLMHAIQSKKLNIQEKALQTIQLALENDHTIPEALLSAIMKIDKRKGIYNVVQTIIDPKSKFLILIDIKKDDKTKLEALKNLNREDFKPEFIQQVLIILIDIILYSPKLNIEALKAFLRFIDEDFNINEYNVNVIDLILSTVNSDLDYKTLQDLLVKTNTTMGDVMSSVDVESKEKLQEIIFGAQRESDIAYLSDSNFEEFSNFIKEKIASKDWVTYNETMLIILAFENGEFKGKFNLLTNLLKKIQNEQALNDSCLLSIFALLLGENNHEAFDDLLQLLSQKDQEVLNAVKSNPTTQLMSTISELTQDPENSKALMLLKFMWKEIKPEHVAKLRELSLKSEIDLKIRLQILKVLKNHADGNFSSRILSRMIENFDDVPRHTIASFPSSKKFSLALAFAYANAYQVELDGDVFSKNNDDWAFNILCRVLFEFIATDLDSELQPIIDSLDIFRFNFSGEKVEEFTKPKRDVEDLLMKVLDNIDGDPISSDFLQDILTMVSSSLEVYEYFQNEIESWKSVPMLRRFWLTLELSNAFHAIEIDEIKKLMIMLDYRPSTIMMLFTKVDITIDPEEIIKIFELLKSSDMPRERKYKILSELEGYPCHEWLNTVVAHVVHRVLINSIPYFENSDEEFNALSFELQRLCETGWSEFGIARLTKKIKSKEDMKRICPSIRILYEFKVKEFHQNFKDQNVIDIFNDTHWDDLESTIYDLAIRSSFEGTKQKDLIKLDEELKLYNKDTEIKYLISDNLKKEYDSVMEAAKGFSKVNDRNFKPIEKWNTDDIGKWAMVYQYGKASIETIEALFFDPTISFKRPEGVSLYEEIAVAMQAVYVTKGYRPRTIQVLSLLMLLNPEEGKGRLMQINTGEGKTTIVAMLAVIKALAGHKVDVVTSSPELARPQSRELVDFYKMFGLTTSHNGDDPVDKSIRYKCNIVYGAASDFQADILREEYSMESIRSGRGSDLVIVDEADSMLIDGRNYIVMLSSQMPAMNYLEPILAAIWSNLNQYSPQIIERNGEFYYIHKETEANAKTGEITVEGDNQGVKIELNKFVKESLLKTMKKILTGDVEKVDVDDNREKTQPLAVPTHLKEFILNHQLEMWIDSAIHAKFLSKESKNYILDNQNKIIPVDSDNTGVLQKSMHWSNGLHQFLQMKHGTTLTAESITTNFISNVEFFQRYGDKVYGMTGTLGSIRSKYFLEKTYNVDSIIVPGFKVKRYKELSAVINYNENEWYNEIVETNLRHLKKDRAVLIITKYIEEAEELQKRFKTKHPENKIRIYRDDTQSKAVQTKVDSGDIIIATNIAGRGTDIKTTHNVEDNGGLHVCVTFLPPNERVEHQNVGRTARTGNKGTGQFIIIEKKVQIMDKLKLLRNYIEEQEINEAEMEIIKTLEKDAVFKSFCKLLVYADDEFERKAIEERFGIWLQINSNKSKNLAEDFVKFREEIHKDLTQKRVIRNPSYYIQRGNKFLESGESDKKNYDEAVKDFTRAIELDSEFAENAFYNRAVTRIAQHCGEVKKKKDEIRKARDDFMEARKRIKNRETELNVLMQANAMERGNILSDQISRKLVMLGIQKAALEQAIGMSDEDYNQQVQAMERTRDEKEKAYKEKNTSELKKEYEDFKEQLQAFIDSNPKEGVIQKVLNSENNMKFERFEIAKSFPKEHENIKLFEDEIAEFAINGFIGKFEVSEIPPIDWGNFFAVFFIGLGQFVAGALLTVFTVGAGVTLGKALMTEGINDMITAVKDCLINRDFNWKSYGIQKAISIVATILCAGIDGLKDAAKTAMAGFMGVAKVAATTVGKSGLKIALQVAGVAVLKEITEEFILPLANSLVDKVLMNNIKAAIHEKMLPLVKKWLTEIPIVLRMFALDIKTRTLYYVTKIVDVVKQYLYEASQRSDWAEFGLGVAKRVVSQKIPFGKALWEVGELSHKAIQIFHYLKQIIREKFESKEFVDDVEKNEKFQNSEEGLGKSLEKQAIKHIVPLNSKAEAIEKVSGEIAENLTTSLNQSIVRPITSSFVSKGIDKMYSKVEAKVDKKLENYKAERRIIFTQNKDRSRLPSKYKMKGLHEDQKRALRERAQGDIDEFENGSMVGIHQMGSVADAVGKPIKVLDKKGKVIAVFGEDNGGEPLEVQYHEPGKKYERGHFTLPGGQDPPKKYKNNGENDCLFNVLASQANLPDPNKIRQDAARAMKKNIDYQAMQFNDVDRLKRLKPKKLREGGITEPNRERIPKVADYLDSLRKHGDLQLAGTYKEMKDKFEKRGGLVDLNHIPPKSVMGEHEDKLPIIAMAISDHRRKKDDAGNNTEIVLSTGISKTSKQYRGLIRLCLGPKDDDKTHDIEYSKNEKSKSYPPDKFSAVLYVEYLDTVLTAIKNESGNYIPALKQHVEACKKQNRILDDHEKKLNKFIDQMSELNANNQSKAVMMTKLYKEAEPELMKLDEEIKAKYPNKDIKFVNLFKDKFGSDIKHNLQETDAKKLSREETSTKYPSIPRKRPHGTL